MFNLKVYKEDDFVDFGSHPGGLKKVPNGGEILMKMKGTGRVVTLNPDETTQTLTGDD